MRKRILSLCLAIVMLLGSVPMEVFANTGNPDTYMEGQLPPGGDGQALTPPVEPVVEEPEVKEPVVEEPVVEEPVVEEPVLSCDCETHCTEAAVNSACPVCAADFAKCIIEAPEEEQPEPSCDCETHCTEDAVNAACPVCAADFTKCIIEAPEEELPEPSCDCETHCTEEAVNAACPVCAGDFTKCAIEAPVEEQPEPSCDCETHCTEEAVNTVCPVCAEDFTQCVIGQTKEEESETTCDCEERCTEETVNAECPVCAQDHSACTVEVSGMTADEVAELFRKLPEVAIFDYYVSPEDWEQIEKDLYAAFEAYDLLCELNFEEALLFNELYADLYLNAAEIESFLLDNPGGSPYATDGGFDVYYSDSNRKFTITLGNGMDDVAPQVIRFNNGDPITYEVVKTGDRKYSFADNTNSGNYIITGSAAGYADQQVSISANGTNSTTLQVKTHTGSGNVKLFYLYSNNVPQPYNGASTDNAHYGPSGTGSPFVTLSVDLEALSRMDGVVYNGSSSWYFIPQYNSDGTISTDNVRTFWNAVLACTTENSLKELRDTGLYDIFAGYIVKTEWDGPHGDGIFDVAELPIYVAELYDNNTYFGSVTGTNNDMKNLDDVLALCDQNLGGTVYWQTQSLEQSIGYYYGNNNRVIKVTVVPFDNGNAIKVDDSDIKYTKKAEQYYLAKFRMTTTNETSSNTYSVTYTDGVNGSVFTSVSYPVVFTNTTPKIPAYNGTPTRVGYTFKGWKCLTDESIDINQATMPNMVKENLTFEAQWEVTKYTVTWANYDGSVLDTDVMAYGATPSYQGSTVPTRPSDEQYTYAFTGWTPAIDIVTKDVTYTALYESFLRTYTVTWCDDQGKVLETDHNVPYGTMPSYDGAAPTKANTAQYTYTFDGWDPEVKTVTGNATYTAQFQAEERRYTVRWLDDNGTVLETDYNVLYGTEPAFNGQNPSKKATAEHTYTFTGWTPTVEAVTGDIDYVAVYTQTTNTYTVTWVSEGTTVETDTGVPYGTVPTYDGETPVKTDPTGEYTYVFSNWTPAVSAVTGNQTYTAQFSGSISKYNVIWKYGRNLAYQELDADQPYGTKLSFSKGNELNYESGNYNYIFTGWQIEGQERVYTQAEVEALTVTGHITLNAQYRAELKGHTVNVQVLLNATSQAGGTITGGTPVSIETVMGEGTTLYLCANRVTPIALAADSAVGSYSALLVPNGQYKIYYSTNGTDLDLLSDYEVLVAGADVQRPLYFYSVTYDLNGGNVNGSTNDIVTYHRDSVDVDKMLPQKEGATFLGWQLEDSDTLYAPGDHLTDAIRQGYTLTALWGDAELNLVVKLHHEHYVDGVFKGRDQNDSNTMTTDITYRTNTSEDYVEMVGIDERSQSFLYSGGDYTTVRYDHYYTGLDNRYMYNANVFVPGYEVVSRSVSVDESGKSYTVTVEMQYRPHMFNMEYSTEMVSGTAEALVPKATDVKIISYRGNNSWLPISAHTANSTDVFFNKTATGESYARFGSGSYALPVHLAEDQPYYYRTAAVGFTLKDGTELINVSTLTGDVWTFTSKEAAGYPAGAYTAQLIYGAVDNAVGVFANETDSVQQGSLKLLVTAHPDTIVLHYNDGKTDNQQIENVFSIPNLDAYAPGTRTGFTFDGWYLDEALTQKAAVGTLLNITDNAPTNLYAKWNGDITVSGTVYVSKKYGTQGAEHEILPDDRLQSVTVRVMNDQNLPIKGATVEISYPNDKDYGLVNYQITGIPDNGTRYSLQVLQAAGDNYDTVYQNEPDSLTAPLTFTGYGSGKNAVLTGTDEPLVATVNAYLHFNPETYNVKYAIDATAIGEAFRPSQTRTLIRADDSNTEVPDWYVITQMVDSNGNYNGQTNTLTDGRASGSYPVWKTHANGYLYNFSARLQDMVYKPTGEGEAQTVTLYEADTSMLPFVMSYVPQLTYYDASASEQQTLKIILTPKKYAISYVANGGTMPETYATEHTWSFETALTAQPTREGYSFLGWYTDASLQDSSAVTAIGAEVAQDVTLYAKWQTDPYRIDYTLNGGSAQGNPTSYNVQTPTFTLNAPTREGYTFLGWTGSNGNTYEKLVTIPKGTTGDLSYTAHWEKSQYVITVTVENGTADCAASVTVTHGDEKRITFTADSGYALDTVTVDGAAAELTGGSYTFTNISGNHSIEVVYATDVKGNDDDTGDGKPDKYQATVTYAVVNGSFGENVKTSHVFDLKNYINGQWVAAEPKLGDTLPTVNDGELIPAEGYDGTGYWRENITADTPVTADASYTWEFTGRILHTVTYPDASREPNASGIYPDSITNKILYGSVIRVDPNGGQWIADVSGTTQTYTDPYEFPLKKNVHLGTPVREHYVFKGWIHTPGENGIAHVYTAQWAPKVYNIRYVMPNSFLDVPNPTQYTVETETFTLNNPRRSGYVFDGWNGTGITGMSKEVIIPKGSSGDRVYTANWTAKTDTPYEIRYYLQDLDSNAYVEDETNRKNRTGTTDSLVSIATDEYLTYEGFRLNLTNSRTEGTLYGSGDQILYLCYDRKEYTVLWKNGDTVLEKDEHVRYGAEHSYGGKTPEKTATDEFTYTFSGWTLGTSTEENVIVYQAQFTQTKNKYTVTWLNYDGQLLRKDSVEYGELPDYGDENPTRGSGAIYYYTFSHWTPTVEEVTGNAEYTAVYTPHARLYNATVSFYVDDKTASEETMADSLSDGRSLWIKADSETQYTALVQDSNAAYKFTAQLPVGDYRVYLYDGVTYTAIGDSYLSIIDQAAGIDIHFYTVTYNGGMDNISKTVEYYLKGAQVSLKPAYTKQGYYFVGWEKSSDNTILQPETVLTGSIAEPYELTGVWSDTAVRLRVTVDHTYSVGTNETGRHTPSENLKVTLTYRKAGNTTGSYVEVVGQDSTIANKDWYSNGNTSTYPADGTYYTLFDPVDNRYDYGANVFLKDYILTERSITYNEATREYLIDVKLQYNPEKFVLTYSVEADSTVPDTFVPQALDIQIYKYENSAWKPISAHENSSVDVVLTNRLGSGSYNLPATNEGKTLHYSIHAVGLTLADGTELPVTLTNKKTAEGYPIYESKAFGKYPEGAFTVVMTKGKDGVHALQNGTQYVQDGELELVIYAHPAQLSLDRNYQDAPTGWSFSNIFAVPDLIQYVPEREGYTFLGWYKEANGTNQAQSGEVLTADSNVTYYAKWAHNLTVSGTIESSNRNDGKLLPEGERLKDVTVTLHRKDNGAQVGLPVSVTLTGEQNSHSYTGPYSFTNVPNDGTEYYIAVSALGHDATFWNEELAIGADFTKTNFDAVDQDHNNDAKVNVKLAFKPVNFALKWQIDASQLGSAFRPENVYAYVMADTDHGEGYDWDVILQMCKDDNTEDPTKAEHVQIDEDGKVEDSYNVWKYNPHGHAYNYAIRIASMDPNLDGTGERNVLQAPSDKYYREVYSDLPFLVYYEYPAFYMPSTNAQDSMLEAVLIPKTYTVNLNPNGGTLTMAGSAVNPITHTWSKETTADFTLTRDGYVFEGWVDQDNNKVIWADEDGLTVPAAVQTDLTLTAQWTKISDLTFSAQNMFKVYNGTKYTGGNDLIISDLPEDYVFEGLTYAVEGSNVGDYTGVFTKDNLTILRVYRDDEGKIIHSEDATEYFDVANAQFTPGILRISQKKVTITAENQEKTYDGKPFTGFTYKCEDVVDGDDLGLDVTWQGEAVNAVNAGTYTIVPNAAITNANYYLSVQNGTLEIESRPVTVTIEAGDKTYDQSNNARATTEVKLYGVMDSDNLTVQVQSITFAGTDVVRDAEGVVQEQTVTASGVTLGGNEKGNYHLNLEGSTLTDPAKINPVSLELILYPVSREYNGSIEVAVTPGDVTPLSGDRIVVQHYPTAGTMETAAVGDNKTVTIAQEALDALSLTGDDAVNYNLTAIVSTVDIAKRKVSLRSASAEKTYDGTALTAPEITVVEGSFVDGEITDLRAAASLVGSIDENEKISNQPISFQWTGNGHVNNYDISYAYGTLSVLADENQNKIPDDQENRYTVKYLASPEHTSLKADTEHAELLPGMPIPAPPAVTPDTGYCLGDWVLKTGTEGAEDTIGSTDLVYELQVSPAVYDITYVLKEGAVNGANPATYTFGKGVESFAPAERPYFVFMGWYADDTFTNKVTEISTTEHGDKTLYPKWMADANDDDVPDDYQVTVTYQVENGTWADGKTAPIPVLFNLRKLDDNGNWVEDAQKLNTTIPTGMLPDEAHTQNSGKWEPTINADTPVTANATYTYTFGTRHTYTVTVTVTGGTAKVGEAAYTVPVTVEHGDAPVLTFTPDTGKILDYARIKTAVQPWMDITLAADGKYTLAPVTQDVQIQVAFSPDVWHAEEDKTDKPDGIPDSRQVVFLFRAGDTNGTVSGKTTQVVTLTNGNSVAPETVTVQANTGYKLKNWTNDSNTVVANPFAAMTVEGGTAYTFIANFEEEFRRVDYLNAEDLVNFVPQPAHVMVRVAKQIQVDPNGGIWRQSPAIRVLTILEDEDLGIPVREGYLFIGWLCEPVRNTRSVNEIVYQFTAQWMADGNGDGTPDQYQKKVTFRIVNGVWSVGWFEPHNAYTNTSNDIVVYLNLLDTNGKPSETGSAYLTPYVPLYMKPNRGYHKGSWDVTPPEMVSGNNSVTYTYSYERKPAVNPKTGDGFDTGMWMSLMAMSVAGMLALSYPALRDKKKRTK